MSKITNGGLIQSGTGCLIAVIELFLSHTEPSAKHRETTDMRGESVYCPAGMARLSCPL